ncbi:hypothetical protein Vspart_01336 [Vibrio spartinae]|uniref:Uncharacterized protein n=1 Tax=Vibrio spartinae TaxID=1918945 RepID=A0ABX6QXV5_9VIBR|nr:hypothetical protein Vspart_01336 [Vibrio spartinae]
MIGNYVELIIIRFITRIHLVTDTLECIFQSSVKGNNQPCCYGKNYWGRLP